MYSLAAVGALAALGAHVVLGEQLPTAGGTFPPHLGSTTTRQCSESAWTLANKSVFHGFEAGLRLKSNIADPQSFVWRLGILRTRIVIPVLLLVLSVLPAIAFAPMLAHAGSIIECIGADPVRGIHVNLLKQIVISVNPTATFTIAGQYQFSLREKPALARKLLQGKSEIHPGWLTG